MSVGIGIIGREVTFTFGAGNLLGVTSTGLSFTNEMGETQDMGASGWTEFLAAPLKKSCEFSISGITKNMELLSSYFASSNIFAVVVTYPDGSTVTFDAAMTGAPSFTHESDALSTYEASFTSSGAITFTAGV